MQEERPERIIVWGFVIHITEFANGNKAEQTLALRALSALDQLLAMLVQRE